MADQPLTKRHLHQPPGRVFSDTEDIYQYLLAREAQEPWPQRTTDLSVVRTGLATGVTTFIVLSPTVYGRGLGSFKKTSFQGPTLVRAALKRGRAVYVGDDGAAKWDHVHIEDVAALYEILVGRVLAGAADLPSGEKGFFFATSGKHSWRALAEAVGRAGHELGALDTPEAVSVSLAEFAKDWCWGNEGVAELAFASG